MDEQFQTQKLIEMVRDAMIVLNDAGEIVFSNPQTEKILGYKKQEIIGRKISVLLPDKAESEGMNLHDLFASHLEVEKLAVQKEMRVKKKDGTELSVEMNVTPLFIDGAVYLTAEVRDISERKKTQRELLESELRYRAVVEHAFDSIITLTAEGTISSYNRASELIFGYPERSILGEKFDILIAEDHHKMHLTDLLMHKESEKGLGCGKGVRESIVCKRSNGTNFPAEISLSQVRIDEGLITVWITRDMTERESAGHLKRDFVSLVSHELRTPLTCITGSIAIILGGACGAINEMMKKLLEIASRNGERLTSLINDLLDVGRIEAGKMDFAMENVELGALAHEAIENIRLYADKFKVSIAYERPPHPVIVFADPKRLTQVLTNLLSNAIKFSPENESVAVHLASHNGKAIFTVRDRGPGVPEEFRLRLFQPFMQCDSSDTRAKGGTGLGLFLSKQIIDHFQGKICYISPEGGGAEFAVELPLA